MVDDDNERPDEPKRSGSDSEPTRPRATASNEGQRGGVNAPQSTIHTEELVGGDKVVNHYYGESSTEARRWTPEEPIRRYLAWLAADKATVGLRGIGGGDINLRLAEVYVPLHLARSRGGASEAGELCGDDAEFELSALFARLPNDPRRPEDRHALILGHPGSGKSTATRKLDLLVRDQARRAAGEALAAEGGADATLASGSLGRDYLPARVLLRNFGPADRDRALRDFVARELKTRSGGQVDDEVFAALWGHRRLVLILDGLDEIVDLELRKSLCRKLNTLAAAPGCAARVVVTSRISGYRELRELPSRAFARVELKPLSPEQAAQLIRQWFHALVGEVESFSDDDANARTDELTSAIEDPRFADGRRSMYATPLILTLLCVMNYRRCTMPESRVDFYESCLKMLLETWPAQRAGAATTHRPERPLTTAQALDLLTPIAHAIHTSSTGEQLHEKLLLAKIGGALPIPLRAAKRAVFRWLSHDAGIFEKLAPQRYGFFHLGVQEFLTALHVAQEGPAALRSLASRVREAHWREVVLMAGALPKLRAFAPLMEGLLQRFDPQRDDEVKLLAEAVQEGRFDVTPFAAALGDEALDGHRAHGILTLVVDRRESELAEPARGVAARARREAEALDAGSPARAVWERVEARAIQLVAAIEGDGRGERAFDVAVVGLASALPARRALLWQLRTATPERPLRVWPPEGDGPPLGELDTEALAEAVDVVFAAVSEEAPWRAGEGATGDLCLLGQDLPLILVLAPGAAADLTDAPSELTEPPLDQRRGWDVEALRRRLRPAAAADGIGPPVVGRLVRVVKQVCVEPVTGMRFLYVPEGVFTMGSRALGEASQPEHLVRVPEFWIAETPVTNRIYRLFVEAKQHRAPRAWRDRRFDNPEQPVVTVTWDDAKAFCAWMSAATGWTVELPSEAQWEYAARGRDGRVYPWGDALPDDTRACFDRDRFGSPAAVGSYPAGMGPFGALDQAGTVWEWCEDRWDRDAYKRRRPPPEINEHEVVRDAKTRRHVIRGGGWQSGRGALAAAYRRYWRVSGNGGGGFRVLVSREPA